MHLLIFISLGIGLSHLFNLPRLIPIWRFTLRTGPRRDDLNPGKPFMAAA